MKRFYKLFVLVFSLFALTSFYSCDKSNEKLYGTWECNYFEVEYKDTALPPHPYYLDEELVLRGEMTLVFQQDDDRATMIFNNLELFDKKNNIIYYNADGRRVYRLMHTATYTYNKGKNLTLTFDDYGPFPRQTWTGKVKKNTIDLTIIFGKTVTFKKQ